MQADTGRPLQVLEVPHSVYRQQVALNSIAVVVHSTAQLRKQGDEPRSQREETAQVHPRCVQRNAPSRSENGPFRPVNDSPPWTDRSLPLPNDS